MANLLSEKQNFKWDDQAIKSFEAVKEAIAKGRKRPTHGGSMECNHRNFKGNLVVIYNIRGVADVEIVTAYRK